MKPTHARLLFAAPAMLAALKAIVAEVGGGMRPYSTDSWLPAHLVDAAMDAIDKAEGLSHDRE